MRLSDLKELTKIRIAGLAGISTITGFVAGMQRFDGWGISLTFLAIFLTACGAATLNHLQDRDLDAKMERTRNRPIPSGRVSNSQAFILGTILVGTGIALFYYAFSLVASVLAFVTVIWYNLVYYYLKRKTPFAAVPGGVVGALPPVIGWVAAGGNPLDPFVISLALFFFLWQVPHFWLLLLYLGEDYGRAALPSLTKIMNQVQFQRVIFSWIAATGLGSFSILWFDQFHTLFQAILYLLAMIWLVWGSRSLLFENFDRTRARRAFMRVNFYSVIVMMLIVFSAIIRLNQIS